MRLLYALLLFPLLAFSQEKISQMPVANPLTGNELQTLVQSGWNSSNCPNVGPTGLCNVQTTVAQLAYVFNPQTPAEIAASVLPANYFVAPCNVNRYLNNTTPGTTDMSGAWADALLACNKVYAPTGVYLVGGITVPNTYGLTMYGDGNSSQIIQKSTGQLFQWNTAAVVSGGQFIRDLYINAQNGTAHTINTTGTQILKLQNIYFANCPVSFDCIFMNGTAATTAHDNLLDNIQIYNGTNAANAGIELGALMEDTTISKTWMNGNNDMSYGIKLNSGASAIKIIDSSPYNMVTNDILAVGNNNYLQINHNVFGPVSTGSQVSITASSFLEFTDNFFENIAATFNGVTLNSTIAASFSNNIFSGNSGAGYAVAETGSANYTYITGGGIAFSTNFTAGINSLSGANSSVCNEANAANFNCGAISTGATFTVSGCGTAGSVTGADLSGSFVVGTGASTCTFVVTPGYTAKNRWVLNMDDDTAKIHCTNIATPSTTTGSAICNSTVTTGDVITFSITGN